MKKNYLLFLFLWVNFLVKAQLPANEVFKQGFTLFQSGVFDQALNAFNQAIEKDPNRNFFYYHRANTLKALNRKPEAIADYEKSIELKETAEAHYQLGLLYLEQKDTTLSFPHFLTAKSLRDDFEKINFYMGLIHYKNNQQDSALIFTKKYIENNKLNIDGYVLQGMILAKQNNINAAIQSLDKALVINSKDWKIYYKYYEIYMQAENHEKALYNLSMVIEMGQRKSEYYAERSKLYAQLGNKFKADEDALYAKDPSKAK